MIPLLILIPLTLSLLLWLALSSPKLPEESCKPGRLIVTKYINSKELTEEIE